MNTRKRPASARILNQWVDSYARQHDQPPARVRNWVSHMVLGGALERAGFGGMGRRFTIKGGVALEMRLRQLARATKDLDLVLLSEGDLVEELAASLQRPYEGFSFRLRGEPELMPNQAVRVEVALQYRGKGWGTVQVDVARQEGGGTEIEMVDAISLSPFGLEGPEMLPCLSLPYHVAQKIHAMTAPVPDGRPNHRFRDLVDLLLLRDWIEDFDAVRGACRNVFETRGTHAWPPTFFAPPDHWVEPYARMAGDLGLGVIDVHQAAFEVRAFINRIDDSAELASPVALMGKYTATTWFFVVAPDARVCRIPASIGEDLYMNRLAPETSIPDAWQWEPGGVALIGIVVILQDRRPLFVERAHARGVPLSDEIMGKTIAFTPSVWVSLAEQVLQAAKAPVYAIKGLAVFLSRAEGLLPCALGKEMGMTSRDAHEYFARTLPWGDNDPPLWDLWRSQPVQRAMPIKIVRSPAVAAP